MKKITLIGLVLPLALMLTFLPVPKAYAQVGGQSQLLPFGGFVLYPVTCLCSGTIYIWFAPLYMSEPYVTTGPMIYSPYSSILYAYYLIGEPTTWELGDYVSGGQCQVYIGTGCVNFPAMGLMNKVGTSYPGFSVSSAFSVPEAP